MKLSRDTRILLQCLVSSKNDVPVEILDLERPRWSTRPRRRGVETGIERKFNCDVSRLPEGLYRVGYGIEEVYWQRRYDGKIAINFFLSMGGVVAPSEADMIDALSDLVISVWDAKIVPNTNFIKISLRHEHAVGTFKPTSSLLVADSSAQYAA